MRKEIDKEEVTGYWRGLPISSEKEKEEIEKWNVRHGSEQEIPTLAEALESPFTESVDKILVEELMEIHPTFPLTSFLLKPVKTSDNQKKVKLPLTWVRRGITQ